MYVQVLEPRIQMSTNIPVSVTPRKLNQTKINEITVYSVNIHSRKLYFNILDFKMNHLKIYMYFWSFFHNNGIILHVLTLPLM